MYTESRGLQQVQDDLRPVTATSDLPIWHARLLRRLQEPAPPSVTGAKLDANDYVTLDYRLDPTPTTPWTALGHLFTNGTYEWVQFPVTA